MINLQYRGNNFVISRARVMRVLLPLYRNIEMCISCIDYVQLVDDPISFQRDYLANLERNECVDRYWNFHKKSDSLNIVIFCTIILSFVHHIAYLSFNDKRNDKRNVVVY